MTIIEVFVVVTCASLTVVVVVSVFDDVEMLLKVVKLTVVIVGP